MTVPPLMCYRGSLPVMIGYIDNCGDCPGTGDIAWDQPQQHIFDWPIQISTSNSGRNQGKAGKCTFVHTLQGDEKNVSAFLCHCLLSYFRPHASADSGGVPCATAAGALGVSAGSRQRQYILLFDAAAKSERAGNPSAAAGSRGAKRRTPFFRSYWYRPDRI